MVVLLLTKNGKKKKNESDFCSFFSLTLMNYLLKFLKIFMFSVCFMDINVVNDLI